MAGRRSPRLIAVVGMVREARIVAGGAVTVIIGGGQAERTARRLETALADGAAGIVSFGLCGGLDPTIRAGDLIVDSDEPAWRQTLQACLPAARAGTLAGGVAAVAGVAEKAALRRRSGAAGVDMESHLVCEFARRSGLPHAVVRAVSDPADRALPSAALAGFATDGREDVAAVLRGLARRPWELPALLRTAADAQRAFAALADARARLGPELGCPNLV